MSTPSTVVAGLVTASLLAGAGYAAARSCAKTLAEHAELELIEVTIDGKPVGKPTGYDLGTVTVWRRWDGVVLLHVRKDMDWFWVEEYER